MNHSTLSLAGVVFLLNLSSALADTSITVATDGSGKFKTVQEAIAAAPVGSAERTTILIGPGTYQGNFIVPKEKINLTLKGQDPKTTILTWPHSTFDPKPDGAAQFNPGLWVEADGFQAEGLTIENTAGDRGQALAAEFDCDAVTIKNCRILGWQDTLFINNGRQYYDSCYIEGRVDFIYGNATAVFKNCEIHSKNGGFITAASTNEGQPYGFVFIECKLTGSPDPWIDPSTGQAKSSPGALALLGRPWRDHANVAYINCTMDDHIRPEGWSNWDNPANEKTVQYAEYNSKTLSGGTVDISKRLPWTKQLSADDAAKYTVANILVGDWGSWDPTNPDGHSPNVSILAPRDAQILGDNAKLEGGGTNLGYWSNTDTQFKWSPTLNAGTYHVGLTYSLDAASVGCQLQIKFGDKTLTVTPPATSGWDNYSTVAVGDIQIEQAGPITVQVQALSQNGNFILNLKQIVLKKK